MRCWQRHSTRAVAVGVEGTRKVKVRIIGRSRGGGGGAAQERGEGVIIFQYNLLRILLNVLSSTSTGDGGLFSHTLMNQKYLYTRYFVYSKAVSNDRFLGYI